MGDKKQSFACEDCIEEIEYMSHMVNPPKKAIDFALDECTSEDGLFFLDLWRNNEWPEIKARFTKFVLPSSVE